MINKITNIETIDTRTETLERCLDDRASREWDIYLYCGGSVLKRERSELFGPLNQAWSQEQRSEIKEKLQSFLQEFCREMMEINNSTQETELSPRIEKKSREREMQWIENNKDFLETLLGNWIIVEGDKLVASSTDLSIALRKAKSTGINVPFIHFIPESEQNETINI